MASTTTLNERSHSNINNSRDLTNWFNLRRQTFIKFELPVAIWMNDRRVSLKRDREKTKSNLLIQSEFVLRWCLVLIMMSIIIRIFYFSNSSNHQQVRPVRAKLSQQLTTKLVLIKIYLNSERRMNDCIRQLKERESKRN